MVVNDAKVSRMPFISVVNSQEMPTTDKKENKEIKKANQGITTNKAIVEIEELREEINMLKNIQDRYVYACNNGTDEQSLILLTDLIQEKSQKLERISDKNNGNLSLMHLCAIKNKPLCLNLLAENKVRIDILDKIEATPLLHAAANNCPEALAFLISKKANVNARDAWGKFPLQVALKNKHYKIAEILASVQSLDVHQRGTKSNTVLHNMGAEGDLTAVQFLMQHCNATPQRRNSDEENVLQHSLAHANVVEYICKNTDKKVLHKMITNVNIVGSNVIHECCRHGYMDSLIVLLKTADLAEMKLDQIIKLLNAQDNNGDTPLHLAVKQGNQQIVKFLCQATETKINLADGDGNTPLYYAASHNHTKIIALLTSVGGSFKPDSLRDAKKSDNLVVGAVRSLKTLLALLLSFVAISCTITIAAISIGFFGSYVSTSTTTIRTKYFEKVVNHLSDQINQIDIAFDIAYSNGVNLFNVTDAESVFRYNAPVYLRVRQLPLIRSVVCSKPNAALASLTRKSATSDDTTFLLNYDDYLVSYRYPVRDYTDFSKLNISEAERLYPQPGPLLPYMANAKKYNTTIWTDSSISVNYPGFLFLFVSRGFRNPVTGEYLGACHFISVTEYLSKYLQTTKGIESSTTVLIERNTGFMIGVSDVDELIYEQFGNVSIRYDGTNAKNKDVSNMVRFARKKLGGANYSLLPSNGLYLDKAYFDRRLTAINVGNVANGKGLDWIVIQSVPLQEFFGNFVISIVIMCVAGVVLVVASIMLSIVLAYLFMRPIQGLIRQSEAIKLLQLENVEQELKQSSFFTEIRSLQQSFQSMTIRLKQFRNFIPDHILTVIEDEVGARKKVSETNSSLGTKGTDSNSKTHSDGTESVTAPSSSINGSAINKALNSALTSGIATIMTVKLPDYVQSLELYGAADIDETSKELLSLFMDIIRISKGQFVSITSSSAVIAWNTLMKQPDHTTRACKAARSMQEGLKKLHTQWRAKNLPQLDVSIGIARGTIYYGNMGTDRMKYFTIIGTAAEKSCKMTEKTASWGVQFVCDDNVHEVIKDEFYTRPLQKYMADDGNVTGIIYELGDAISADAWANELNTEMKETSNWKIYNEAHEYFQRGQYDDAYELFVQFLQTHPTDIPAQNMMAACQAQKDEITPSATLSENTITLVEQQ